MDDNLPYFEFIVEVTTLISILEFLISETMLSIPKLEALIKKGEESTVLIPKLEDNIPKLQKLLLDEEKVLEEITESSKGEVFSFLYPTIY